MSQTRTLGRYKLKSCATANTIPRQYGILVTHRDTGDMWMFELPEIVSTEACEAVVDFVTLAEIQEWTAKETPMPFKSPELES